MIKYKKATKAYQFHDNKEINAELNSSSGAWRDYVDTSNTSLTLQDFRYILYQVYDLQEDIADRIVFTYKTYTNTTANQNTAANPQSKPKPVTIKDPTTLINNLLERQIYTSSNGHCRALSLADLSQRLLKSFESVSNI